MPHAAPLLISLALIAGCAGGVSAQPQGDAAMFRGDAAHTGVYPAQSGRALAGVQWRFRTDGDVVSSAVALGGTVYVGSEDGRLYALDQETGALRWRYDAGSAVSSSPALTHGLVIFGTLDGRFVALNAADGAVRWRLATGPTLPFPWGHESGDVYTSSPVVAGDRVYVGAGDGRVYALDAATGRTLWTAATEGRVRATPAVADGRVIVGSADGRVYAFDEATGAPRWRFETAGAALDSRNFGFDRRTVQSSPAVRDGVVYVGARDGFLYALDAASGRLRWQFDHKVSWVNSSPAVADGMVYAASSDGQFVQAVDVATGRELWRTKTGVTWASPSVAGDVLYSGDASGALTALDRRSGAKLWSFRAGDQIWATPTPVGDQVIVGSTDGAVYALRVGAESLDRAVFFDSAYIKSASHPDPAKVAAYLGARGYASLGAAALHDWLAARVADRRPSVVVFAVDHLPPNVVDSAPERSLLRRYLDAGGKVVWPGIPPLLFPRDPATGQAGGLAALNWNASTRLLGVPMERSMFDRRGVRPTPDGERWGLGGRWRTGWSIAPSPDITVLGLDDWGLAAAWAKRYGGPEGTGFVLVPREDAYSLYMAAEHRGR